MKTINLKTKINATLKVIGAEVAFLESSEDKGKTWRRVTSPKANSLVRVTIAKNEVPVSGKLPTFEVMW